MSAGSAGQVCVQRGPLRVQKLSIVWPPGAQNLLLLAVLTTPAIHRGKEFDWHYFRTLWEASDRAGGTPAYVFHTLEDPYEVRNLRATVYRHPSIDGVRLEVGARPESLVPPGALSDRLLLVTRTEFPPVLQSVAGLALIYESESGYVRMARSRRSMDGFGMEAKNLRGAA